MLSPVWSTLIAFMWHATTIRAQYYPITGVQTGRGQSGSRPARRNILDVQNDGPTFSLYIQALIRMQNTSESDPLSYFQIAGIHGRPFISWNNVENVPGAPRIGYCTHTSVLFTTWHRPYLALYEQILAGHAQAIAKNYPPASAPIYQAAADNFRIPYWDWGLNGNMPDITNSQTVQITTPTGIRSVNNPLFAYKFQTYPLNPSYFPPGQDYPLPTYRQTTREPFGTINSRLRSEGFQRRTWQSLAKSRSFNSFSTAATPGTSIEAVHNSVHGDIGLHMSTLAYSAYDPIFWLHHTNVDRLFAMWQAINPTLYLTPLAEPQGTWTIRVGNLDTSATPLTPFTINRAGQFYTSDSSRSLAPFGHTYPEIQDWNQTPDQLRANVTAQLNRLYNPTGTLTKRATPYAPGSQVRAWSVGISVSKFDVSSKFIVRLFLGEPPKNPMDWFASKGCVGSMFIHPPPNANGYYGPNQKIVVHDEIDLEGGLREKGYDGQDVRAVVGYLRERLQWRVQTYDGAVVPTEQVPSLKIMVQEEIVTLAKYTTELPEYGKKTLHPEVTEGRAGGFMGTAAG